MARMISLLKKDYPYIIFGPVITVIIPLILLLVFSQISNREINMGVYGSLGDLEGYKIEKVDSLETGIGKVQSGAIAVFYDANSDNIYVGEHNKDLALRTNEIIKNPTLALKVLSKEKKDNLMILFLTLLLIIGALSSTTIVGFTINMDRIKSMLVTPLSHAEFIYEKVIVVFFSFAGTGVVSLLLLNLLNYTIDFNVLNLFVFSTASLFLLTSISLTITLAVRNVELSETFNSLFIYLCMLLSIYAYQGSYKLGLPITSGLSSIINFNKFPLIEFAMISILSVIILMISTKLFRRKLLED